MNKVVMITGATSGIGMACARKFAENGDRLILTGRNEDRLADIKKELVAQGADVLTLAFDVRDREKASQAVKTLPAEWQEIDVLVNNAGLALGLEPEYEGNLDEWETMIDTNIKGLLTMTRLVVPGMVQRNSGHIINVGSVAGDAAYAGGNVYCATKAAVKALTDGLRIDVAHTAIRVTNLKPGLVETNFSNIRFHGDSERAANVYKGVKPLTGDDIADVAVYAAHLKGDKFYTELDFKGPTAFMIGNEGNGLTDEMADLATSYLKIPMEGQLESLNASVAASLLMYETHRQRY